MLCEGGRLEKGYESAESENPSVSPNKLRRGSFPTPTPDDSVLMLRAKGSGERQVVEGGRNETPLLLLLLAPTPPPLPQEQGSLPSQDAHTAGGALNPPPVPGGAFEAPPPSQITGALTPPQSGRFIPLHEFPGLSPSSSPPRPPVPAPAFCFAGEGLRMSRQWCWCPTIVIGGGVDDVETGRGHWTCCCCCCCWVCSPLAVAVGTTGFSERSGGEHARSLPTVLALPGLVLTTEFASAAPAAVAAAAPAIAAIAFAGDVDSALLMASAFSRACAWAPPPLEG